MRYYSHKSYSQQSWYNSTGGKLTIALIITSLVVTICALAVCATYSDINIESYSYSAGLLRRKYNVTITYRAIWKEYTGIYSFCDFFPPECIVGTAPKHMILENVSTGQKFYSIDQNTRILVGSGKNWSTKLIFEALTI